MYTCFFALALLMLICGIDNHYQLWGAVMGTFSRNFWDKNDNADNGVVRHYLDDYLDNLDMGSEAVLSGAGELSVQSITDKRTSFLRTV